jgi:glycosyltransferase involved in cell wall biosynthesis
MKTPPDVSVIIPTRNRPQYLGQAVESALAQAGLMTEVLVVNDGDALVSSFADKRVMVLDNGRQGPVPARNLGVAKAHAPLVAFLDDDDWWTDTRHLAGAKACIARGADFVFADGVLRYMSGEPDLPFAFSADERSLTRDNTILISTVCYRRALHDALGHFDEALPYYWDWDWYLRVARSGAHLQRIPNAAAIIRVHAGNMSGIDATIARRKNLDALTLKHRLPPIELKNHESLARNILP